MVRKLYIATLTFIIAVLAMGEALATHNRAGEIIYRRISSTNSLLYEISIITYTKTGGQSDAADRCDLELFFGDGTSEVVSRVNGLTGQGCDPGVGNGVKITADTRYNVYTTTHEFPGFGTYTIRMEDPMRNGGVLNIPDSDNVPFYIESTLTIDLGTGGNQAPILQNPPIDNGCVGVPFFHNPGAVDQEGDSLVYSIVSSKSYSGDSIANYRFPDQVEPGPDNQLSIDPRTGTMTWDSPQKAGEYNVAILIEEYRRNPNSGEVFKVGSIMRDMQIDIGNCPPNNPPIIDVSNYRCVTAGNQLVDSAIARDTDGDRLTLTAVGYPLDQGNGGSLSPDDVVSGFPDLGILFTWQTSCEQVRFEPYFVYFKAKEDNDSPADLVHFETMEIDVLAPPVQITSVQPNGTSLELNWTRAICDDAKGYDIYRFNDSLGFVPPECITGVPESLGYEKIGSVDDVNVTSYRDDDGGVGLIHGQRYCYMIVVTYTDGSESYASAEACGVLIRDVPIINKVSVNITDSVNGTDSIAWFKPIELKVEDFTPPFSYRLSRSTSLNGNYEEVYLSPSSDDPFALDTIFVDQGLNTRDVQYFYRIELLSGSDNESVGGSRPAPSVFLNAVPGDNKVRLTWEADVPWKNDYYVVYRFSNKEDSTDFFFPLDTVSNRSFTDTGLANLRTYRYIVRAVGEYTAEDLKGELVNWSQIRSAIPIDNEIPCSPPNKFIEADCDLERNFLTWDNPNLLCDSTDDVVSYRIYYSPVLGQPFSLIETIDDPNATQYEHFNEAEQSIAGCYSVVSVDSFGNESIWENPLCVDNCPVYELPNVFTPNGDNINDLFHPFPYKFVKGIDIIIYNRWGAEVFDSKDPDINWDGTHKNGNTLPEGVYYYVCTVEEIRLTGTQKRELKGYVHLIREGDNPELAP